MTFSPNYFRVRTSWLGRKLLQINVARPSFNAQGCLVRGEDWRDATPKERLEYCQQTVIASPGLTAPAMTKDEWRRSP